MNFLLDWYFRFFAEIRKTFGRKPMYLNICEQLAKMLYKSFLLIISGVPKQLRCLLHSKNIVACIQHCLTLFKLCNIETCSQFSIRSYNICDENCKHDIWLQYNTEFFRSCIRFSCFIELLSLCMMCPSVLICRFLNSLTFPIPVFIFS